MRHKLILLFFLISVPVTFGKGVEVTYQPIAVSSIKMVRDATGGPLKVVLSLANLSPKSVKAYALKLEYLDRSGQRLSRASVFTARNLLPTDNNPNFSAGEIWEDKYNAPVLSDSSGQPLEIANVRVTVDYVSFEDDTKWGPDESKTSLKLEAIRQGAILERQRLHKILREKGSTGVVQDLDRSFGIKSVQK